jgi:hypothetical protein
LGAPRQNAGLDVLRTLWHIKQSELFQHQMFAQTLAEFTSWELTAAGFLIRCKLRGVRVRILIQWMQRAPWPRLRYPLGPGG